MPRPQPQHRKSRKPRKPIASIRRVHHGSIANLFVRSILADVGEMVGGFTKEHWQQTLKEFDSHCAYTDVVIEAKDLDRDHAIPVNKIWAGLHLYGNIIPACREANNQKGGMHYRDFLNSTDPKHTTVCNLTTQQREDRISRIENFLASTGYTDKVQPLTGLAKYCEEEYAALQVRCVEARLNTKKTFQGLLPASIDTSSMEDSELMPLEDEEVTGEEVRTDHLTSEYKRLLSKYESDDSYKVGRFARDVFEEIFNDGSIGRGRLISDLLTADYSIREVGSYTPVLAEKRERINGYYRHYKDPLEFNGSSYFLASQWNEGRADELIYWLTARVFVP